MATIDESPLPQIDSPQVRELGWTATSDRYTAYHAVLAAEAYALQLLCDARAIKQATERDSAMKTTRGKLVAARVAGYLFLEFERQADLFGNTPSAVLVKWFISPPQTPQDNQHDVIINTGQGLRDNFIRFFRTSNVQYPPPSSHPSRPSFDRLEDMIKNSMAVTGQGYSASRKKVLARDGYRCVVTGVYDLSSLKNCPELRDTSGVKVLPLEVAHIFNESTTQGVDPAVDRDSGDDRVYSKTYHAASAMAILNSFGFSEFVNTFQQSGGVHAVWNMLSLEHNLRFFFDHLDLWFENTDKLHRYKVCTSNSDRQIPIHSLFEGHNRRVEGAPMFVEFNSQYEKAPPPNPLLLALHATCARVAHMSGAAEFFDEVERDVEETRVLATDGTSSCLLDHLLFRFTPIPGVV